MNGPNATRAIESSASDSGVLTPNSSAPPFSIATPISTHREAVHSNG